MNSYTYRIWCHIFFSFEIISVLWNICKNFKKIHSFIHLFIYLFMVVLGLCCCRRGLSLLFVTVCGLLIAVASLVVDHGP